MTNQGEEIVEGDGDLGAIVIATASKGDDDDAEYVVVGDIGGSNTRLQMFRIGRGQTFQEGQKAPGELVAERYYANHKYEDFEIIMSNFLNREAPKNACPTVCCLAVAGPVIKNAVKFTNLAIKGWSISGKELEKRWAFQRAQLVNDFVAQGYGVLTLRKSEMIPINDVPPSSEGPIACIGAGTGLGECFCTRSEPGGRVTCYPSEGGHAEWSPRHSLEMELLTFLRNKFRAKHRVSVERVVSGYGLANIYEFLRDHRDFFDKVDPDIDRAFQDAPPSMKGAVVGKNATKNELCAQAASTFTSAYGSEVGVAALKWLPTGGLYICGGIAAKNRDWILSDVFRKAMFDKGRVSPALKDIPVHLVLAEDTGLRGAHMLAYRMLRDCQAAAASITPVATSAMEIPPLRTNGFGSGDYRAPEAVAFVAGSAALIVASVCARKSVHSAFRSLRTRF